MTAVPIQPLVIIPICLREMNGRLFHMVPETYSEALRHVGCQPLLVPGVADGQIELLLHLADGILLPGSPNNVHPSHFNEEILNPDLPLDPKRDALSLPLVRIAIKRGIPLLGICRGHQEMNVSLGGSLHQAIARIPGYDDHQPNPSSPLNVIYGPAHDVEIQPGGILQQILGSGRVRVNSVHGQGVNRLAPGCRIEALAPDGVIEAISLPLTPGFNLGVQWHPEWKAASNPESKAIFEAFATECRRFRERRSAVVS